jgi:hypothetical protein
VNLHSHKLFYPKNRRITSLKSLQGLNVFGQLRLVFLRREDVMALHFQNLSCQSSLGVHGIYMESHMTFHLESKNQYPGKVRRDGVPRMRKRATSKKLPRSINASEKVLGKATWSLDPLHSGDVGP